MAASLEQLSLVDYHLRIISGPHEGKVLSIGEKAVLGRDQSNDLMLQHMTVSSRHAVVLRGDTQYFVEDLSSTNGTFLNGNRISLATAIVPGDILHLGRARVLVAHGKQVRKDPVAEMHYAHVKSSPYIPKETVSISTSLSELLAKEESAQELLTFLV